MQRFNTILTGIGCLFPDKKSRIGVAGRLLQAVTDSARKN
jgi:hypothetical protein